MTVHFDPFADEDVTNERRDDEGLELSSDHPRVALRQVNDATGRATVMGSLRMSSTEDLSGVERQALVTNRFRTKQEWHTHDGLHGRVRHSVRQHHRFRIHEFMQSKGCQFPAVPGAFDAAERRFRR